MSVWDGKLLAGRCSMNLSRPVPIAVVHDPSLFDCGVKPLRKYATE
jgi:hypothetical protein